MDTIHYGHYTLWTLYLRSYKSIFIPFKSLTNYVLIHKVYLFIDVSVLYVFVLYVFRLPLI